MTNYISDGTSLTPASPMFIGISNDGLHWDLISKQGLNVGGIFSAVPGLDYPYATKTIMTFTKISGEKLNFELQDLKGGDLVAYNHGTQVDLNDAVKKVGSWVVSI